MAFEIPQKEDEEDDHRKHANAEVVSRCIRTAPLRARSHGSLDAFFATKCRWKTNLKETLPFEMFRA